MPRGKKGNPHPKIDHLQETMFTPQGREPMGPPIGTRYPRMIDFQLREMSPADRHRLIRAAVAKELDIPMTGTDTAENSP